MMYVLLAIFTVVGVIFLTFAAVMAKNASLSPEVRAAEDIEQMRALRRGNATAAEGYYTWSGARAVNETSTTG